MVAGVQKATRLRLPTTILTSYTVVSNLLLSINIQIKKQALPNFDLRGKTYEVIVSNSLAFCFNHKI